MSFALPFVVLVAGLSVSVAPWANRLGKMAYAVVHEGGGVRRIDVNPNTPNLRFDVYGQPIHDMCYRRV